MRAVPVTITGAKLEFEVVRTADAMSALEAEWDQLYRQAEPRNPFLSHAWTLACWAAQKGEAEPFIATIRERGRLVALAPLCIEKRSGFRILRFIADDRSDYLGFLCAPDVDGLARLLLEHVAGTSGEWDLLLLRQLTDSYTGLHSGPLPAALQRHETTWISAPYCTSDGDWDHLHKTGPSWFREMRKRSRRFHRDGHRTERFTGADAIERLDAVSDVEAHSWKAREQTMRLQPGPGRDLLKRAFETLGDRGEMQLWLAFVEDRAVAFQIDFVLPERLWHYQCAYNEDYRHARAGSVLAYMSLEDAWQRGVREFDYLSGEEPYKLERTNASRSIHHVAAHRRTPRGWLAYALLIAPRWQLRNVAALRAAYKAAQSLKRRLRAQSDG